MAEPAVEKRATRRFAFHLRVALRLTGESGLLQSRTRDVSSRGISFYADRPLVEGSEIQFTLTLPPEVTLTESISMRCIGRVVRVDNSDTGKGVSIAAIIDRYEFLGDS
ncbi:MAG TPA: PilZ domain-containing protein [Terriglobales bacterium]|nr:PilZ domain-containing protein [Terriglobales bacterium]